MRECSSCGNKVSSDSSYCTSCGESLSNSTTDQSSEHLSVEDPNPPPGLIRSIIYKVIPGVSNSTFYKYLTGGCPACGEGKEIEIIEDSGIFGSDAIDYDMTCERCGTKIQSEQNLMKVTDSGGAVDGKSLDKREATLLSKYKRQEKYDKYDEKISTISNKEGDNQIVSGKTVSVISRIYYYPIAIVLFTLGLVSGGGFTDTLFAIPLAGFALPEVRKRLAGVVGFSLPGLGKILLAAVYGFLGLISLYALLL